MELFECVNDTVEPWFLDMLRLKGFGPLRIKLEFL